jgi:hypothetical protein
MIAAASAPASAQVIRTRPFAGLFGSGDPAKSVTQVDFLSYIAGGYESSKASLADGALGSATSDSTFGNLVFRGRLAHQGRRTSFGLNGGATTSFYSGTSELSPFSLSAGTNFSGAVGRRGSFSLVQSVFYSPYYVYGLPTAGARDGSETDPEPVTDDSDPTVDPRVDQRVARLSTKGYSSSARVGRAVGRDGAFFAAYRLNYVDYAAGVYDLVSQAPNAGYRHKISRFGHLIASYGLQMYEYRGSDYPWLKSQNVALGVGYDRPLSAWRRTTVGFNVSTALVDTGQLTRASLNGNARLYRRFGRTGLGGISYFRGQQVLEGFAVPFFTFSDALAGTFSVRIPRDIALSGRLSYSHNTYTIDVLKNEFNTWYASGRVQVPVMWALAVYAEGYYSDHNFQRRLGLLEGIPSQVERVGVRTGLTVQIPVYR